MLLQPGWQLYLLLFFLLVLLPVGTCWLLSIWRRWQFQSVLWSLVVCAFGYLLSIWGLNQNQVLLSEQQLTLKAGLYQTELHNLANAGNVIEVVPFTDLGDYQPQYAVDGIQLPGYRVGWYMLRNRQLAFVMLIGEPQAVSVVKAGDKIALVSADLLRQRGRIAAAR